MCPQSMKQEIAVMAHALERLVEIRTGLRLRQLRVAPFVNQGRVDLLLVHADTPDQQPGMPDFAWPTDTLTISAYTLQGERLWQHDVGRGIIPGLWFCPVLPFDLDGDGTDKIFFVGNRSLDHPFDTGVMELHVLSGATGELTAVEPWPPFRRNQTMSDTFRYLLNGGYSRGRPRLISAQGCYHALSIHAWADRLRLLWTLDIHHDEPGCRASHMFPVLDLDGDGRDEILFGERCIDIDTGEDRWVADRDGYHGHSDIVMPTLDRTRGRWFVFTCREFPWPEGSRGVVMFDDQGREVWGYRGMGHMHAGWSARLAEDGSHRCYAVEVVKDKASGHMIRTEFFYDLEGHAFAVPFPLERTLPVDIDGDGYHELLYGTTAPPSWGGSDRVGAVIDCRGTDLGRVEGGNPRPLGKILECPGEQIITNDRDGTLRIYGCPGARDCAGATARYAHPYYRSCQRLTAVGYNWVNLGGL